jgi:hypothetical protein
MKRLLFLLAFFLSVQITTAQSSLATLHIQQIPEEGVLLDKGWKFKSGDNPDFANADYDDSKWQSINPTLDIRDLPESTKSGICWLRLHVVVDSSLLREQLALIITQSVASEIYLNGRLLYKFGTVSANPIEIKAYDPSGMHFSFPFDKNAQQLLAVRYALQSNVLYTTAFLNENPLLNIHINKTYVAVKQWRRFDRGLPSSIIFRIGALLF